MTLPQPPENLAEWIVLIGLISAGIEGARRRLVNPILKAINQHADDHELLAHELRPNGSEYQLPGGLQGKPLRNLAITGLLTVQRVEKRMDAHDRFSRSTITQINIDRAERGLPPLPEEVDGGAG